MKRLSLLLLAASVVCAQKLPFTAEAMLKLARISEPQLSPDGRNVVFTVQRPELENNRSSKQLYTVPAQGGTPVQVTKDGNNWRPRWTPDSKRIVFVSSRSGNSQVWSMNPDGTAPKQITSLAMGADGVLVSRDGAAVVFTSPIYPECADLACSEQRFKDDKAAGEKGPKPRAYTSLLYRHWTEWQGNTRSHILTCPIDGGPVRDLTPGKFDAPPFSLGGQDDYAISPDSKELAYVANTDPNPATSTNAEIFVVPLSGGEAVKVSSSPGADRGPVYSPDGRYLAYRSQNQAGYESDKWRLMLFDRQSKASTHLNPSQDRNVDEITWSPDSARIFYTLEDRGRLTLQAINTSGGAARQIIAGNSHVGDVQFTPDSKAVIYSENTGSRPTELYWAASGGGTPVALTNLNRDLLAQYSLPAFEEFWVENPADKARVHSLLLKPAGFVQGRKYPLLVLIHGGPQGAWGESWSFRWNPQVFAGAGFVVVMPNPRGSTGYGQKFTDEINQDWGGRVFEDLMNTVDYAAALPYVDGDRIAAAGGSYGGYMVNWILGHSNRFRALVSHAGVFDLRSMAGETEELWFPQWEFHGMPWDNPELYAKLSPSHYVKNFKTPTLVMHGELDYRVPVGQGMQLFTGLQSQNVPSKLVLFPDEGHWILKPRNSLFWYQSFLDWIGEWTRKPAASNDAAAKP